MALLSDFTVLVAPEVQGCSTPIIEQEVLKAAIEFCRDSKYWRYEHPSIPTFEGIPDYELTLPDDSVVESIEDPMLYDKRHRVYQKTRHWLDTYMPGWQNESDNVPEYFIIQKPWVITLVGTPSATSNNGIQPVLILRPSRKAKTIPDLIYEDYADEIAAGAKGRLMFRPNVPWSNPKLGEYYKALFEEAIGNARTKAYSGYKSEDRNTRSKAHYF